MGHLTREQINEVNDSRIKGKLIKDALKIVDELGSLDVDDGIDEIITLIERAEKLKKSRFFDLR